jgi:hypothetical protein
MPTITELMIIRGKKEYQGGLMSIRFIKHPINEYFTKR